MDVLQILNSTLRLASPVILIAIGGMFAIKTDIFNLSLDAFALVGCFASIVGTYYTSNILLGTIFGVVITVLFALFYAMFVLEFKVNAVVCSVAFITLANGLTRFLMMPIFDVSGKFVLTDNEPLQILNLGFLDNIPVVGEILNNQTILTYFALAIPFVVYIFLKHTNLGLSMRAIGSNETAAFAAGIAVKKTRYIALILNGIFCGLAGAQLALSLNLFNVGMTAGRGFTALAALILTKSHPLLTLAVGLLFGFADALANSLSLNGYPAQILAMLPYALALIVAIFPPAIKLVMKANNKKKKEQQIMKNMSNEKILT